MILCAPNYPSLSRGNLLPCKQGSGEEVLGMLYLHQNLESIDHANGKDSLVCCVRLRHDTLLQHGGRQRDTQAGAWEEGQGHH